jgi:hypothetical protein
MASDAEIVKWAKRLESVFRDAPQDVWFYVANGTANVLRLDSNGKRKMKRDKITFDDKAVVYTLNGVPIALDGGDW